MSKNAQYTDAALRKKIDEITRSTFDHCGNFHFSFSHIHSQLNYLLDKFVLVRVIRLAKFWKQRESTDPLLLQQRIEDLITGMYGQQSQWAFWVKGSPSNIECWFALPQKMYDISSAKIALAGIFPDIRFASFCCFERTPLDSFRHGLVLTGIPSLKTENKIHKKKVEQIEKICRGLYETNWLYVVYAMPVGNKETINCLHNLSFEIRNTHANYLLKTNVVDAQNRLAQRYLELLETQLKRFEKGRIAGIWNTQTMFLTDNPFALGRAKALLHSAFSGEQSTPESIRVHPCNLNGEQLPANILNTHETAILSCFPSEEYPGYEIVDYTRFGVIETEQNRQSSEKTIVIGEILDRGRETKNSLNMPLSDVTKHGLIVGVTGSGKTNTCFSLLEQICHENLPFLVIESAKSEYRSLLNHSRFPKPFYIFTVGDETISPLRLNPFEVTEGILVQSHIDYLKSLFSAAFVLYPPMPYILEQSLQEVYEERGWNLATNLNKRGNNSDRIFPTLSDLIRKVNDVTDRMGYEERIVMDVKAGLFARLNQLRLGGGKGLMFNTRNSINSKILFESRCLLELKQIVSDDEKAFIIGLILIRLYEYYEAQKYREDNTLHHVTLIEEAHRLLRNVSTEQGSEVVANPKGRAIEVFANILSEIRAYGEGILIAEQIPTKLTPDAIKNTNLKIVHRLVSEDDRKVIGSTMNLTDPQRRYLATLNTGEAIGYTEGMQKSVLVKIPPIKDSCERVTPERIKENMQSFRRDHFALFLPYSQCVQCPITEVHRNCETIHHQEIEPILSESFKQLFNAMRLNKPLVFETFADFYSVYQQNSIHKVKFPSIYCVFTKLIESEVEERGLFWGWSYTDIDKLIHHACSIISIVAKNWGNMERKNLEQEYSQPLLNFSKLCKRLHKSEILPYAGCRFCSEPCFYRFDMAKVTPDYDEQFTEVAMNVPNDYEESDDDSINKMTTICFNASQEVFFRKDAKSLKDASLCFSIQQLAKYPLSKAKQEEATELFFTYIFNKRG